MSNDDELASAITRGRWHDAERLLAAGADPNADATDERTILELAIEAHNPGFVRRLLNSGADPNQPGMTGDTPLVVAARGDYPVELRTLLDFGADPSLFNTGWTPLRCAAKDRNIANVRILLDAGARPLEKDDPNAPWAAQLDAFVRDVMSEQ